MRKGTVLWCLCLCLVAAAIGSWVLGGRSTGELQVPSEVAHLFRQQGWRIEGNVTKQAVTLPPPGSEGSGASIKALPWSGFAALSKDAGLDFSRYAGQKVTSLSFRVTDAGRERLCDYHLVATTFVHDEGGVIGAWICAPEERPGEIKPGEFRCYSLGGREVR